MDLRRERLAAAAACGLLALRADVPVELDAELGRPLEDVEELAERQPQQREDHRDRVQDGQELVAVALHPGVADRQQQPGDADREEQEQRQEVLLEVLQGGGRRGRAAAGCRASSTPAITRNDDQTRPWKMRWPTSESWGRRRSGSRTRRPGSASGRPGTVSKWTQPNTSGKVIAAARMQPHMMSRWATPARLAAPPDEQVQHEAADQASAELDEVAAQEAGPEEDCQPRRQYSAVGGRCSHIE